MQSTNLQPTFDSDILPDHWEMRIDPRTGLPYYLNHLEQFTTWDDPRLVSQPRTMINNMGSMLRPDGPSQRVRQSSVEPSSSSDRYFAMPNRQNFYAQSLPRRPKNQQQPSMFRRPFMDDFFGNGFSSFDQDFQEPSWPFKSHTLQRPNSGRARSEQPEVFRSRPQPQRESDMDDSFSIPVNSYHNGPDQVAEERIIIPSQFKKKKENTPKDQVDGEARVPIHVTPEKCTSQKKPQAAQEPTSDESKENNRPSNSQPTLKTSNVTINHENKATNANNDSGVREEPLPPVRIVIEEHEDRAKQQDAQPEPQIESEMEAEAEPEDHDEAEDAARKKAIEDSHKGIQKVLDEVAEYTAQVDSFVGEKASKEYRFLEEMLTRCQLALDNVETHGDADVRKSRKDTVNHIESILRTLESKAK